MLGIHQGSSFQTLIVQNGDPRNSPGTPGISGQFLIDTSTNTLYYFKGPLDTDWSPTGSSGASGILWDSNGGGDAVTFEEVMAFVDASNAPVNIYVKANASIPAGATPYQMKGSGFISDPIIGSLTITMDDGAQLNNLGFVEGQLVLDSLSNSLTPLLFNAATGGTPDAFVLRFNGMLRNSGTVPMIEVPLGTFFVLGMILNATLLVPGAAPIINVNGGGGTAVIVGMFGAASINDGWISGPVGAALLYQNLGGGPSPLPSIPGFLGTVFQNLLTGTSCTGVATRPVNPFGSLPIGASVFDQSLAITGQPIWWDGTQWVDSSGNPA